MIKKVRIISNWDWPDIKRQTPGSSMTWEGLEFIKEPIKECDLLVVLNKPSNYEKITVSSGEVWCLVQEPPVPEYDWLVRGYSRYSRVYQQKADLSGKNILQAHGALPWHVNRDYDFLASYKPDKKIKNISAVISKTNAQSRPGNIKRYKFVSKIKEEIDFDWFGKGFQFIEDKWDALAPYRFSLAIENTKKYNYWTEKISDCFLAYSIPIYDGCLNIDKYFPAGSYIKIDIDNLDYSLGEIKEKACFQYYEEHQSELEEARDLVLNKYQLFPFIHDEIQAFLESHPKMKKRTVKLVPLTRDQDHPIKRIVKKVLRGQS